MCFWICTRDVLCDRPAYYVTVYCPVPLLTNPAMSVLYTFKPSFLCVTCAVVMANWRHSWADIITHCLNIWHIFTARPHRLQLESTVLATEIPSAKRTARPRSQGRRGGQDGMGKGKGPPALLFPFRARLLNSENRLILASAVSSQYA